MSESRFPTFRRAARHTRSRLLAGLLILVPAAVTLFMLRLLFNLLRLLIAPWTELQIGTLPPRWIPWLAFGTLIGLIYLIGVLTTRMFGRKLVAVIEWVILKVPIVKSVYGASKQVLEAVRASNRRAFKAVAVIEYPQPGSYSLAFVTSDLASPDGRRMVSVFLPTTPNPTSGYLLVLDEKKVVRTGLTVEEGIKMIISGGVLVPSKLEVPALPPAAPPPGAA